jgi:hypothetical protein
MDMALRAAGIHRHGAEYIEDFRSSYLSIAAHELVTCYRFHIGNTFYDAGRRKEVEQAADFIKKAELKQQQKIELVNINADSPDEAEALFHRRRESSR